jgi:hypothetical protein
MVPLGARQPRPPAVTIGGLGALAAALAWLASTGSGLPHQIWSSPTYGAIRGPFGLVSAVFALLALATLARSPRAWLLLQLLSSLAVLLAGAALWAALTESPHPPGETWLVASMAGSAVVQTTSIVLLNQRRSRRWCRVDPEGYRTFFWS